MFRGAAARAAGAILLVSAAVERPATTSSQDAGRGVIPRFARESNPIALVGPARPTQYLEASGLRAAFLGREDGSFEAWIYPLKVLHGFQLAFRTPAYADPIGGADLASWIDARPEAATVRYAHDSFTADAIWLVPRDEPGGLVLLDIHTSVALQIVVRFRIDLKPMWPAALGGQFSYWDSGLKAYVAGEASRKHAALVGSPLALTPPEQPAHNLPDAPSQFTIAVTPEDAARGFIPIAIAASPEGLDRATAIYARLLSSAASSYRDAAAHYRHVREDLTSIESPDERINLAFEWSKVALDKGFVCNPQLGCGLVAGLGPSGTTERPGFAWFFGGDAFINSWAMTAYGDFETVKRALDFLRARQRADGKMPHEVSQGAAYVRWFEDFPYAYYHADTTPLYITAVRDYVRASGDIAYAREAWPSIRKAFDYCASTDEDGDGLMDNTKAGLAAVETGALRQADVLTDVFLAAAWTEATAATAELAEIAGDSFATTARRAHEKARASLNARFPNDEARSIHFAVTKNGRGRSEATVWPAFGIWRGVFDRSRPAVQGALDALAQSGLATDWGARMLSRESRLYEPLSYNNGAVWPFLSGFAMLALYSDHRADAAWQYLDGTADLTFLGARGYVPELLSGDRLRPIDAAVPHQLFATTGFASGLMRGLVGLREPPATEANAALTIEPQLPAGWTYLTVRRLRWRDAVYDISMKSVGSNLDDSRSDRGANQAHRVLEVTVVNRGRPRPLLVKLALPPGAAAEGGAGELSFGGSNGVETKKVSVRGGIEIAPVHRPLTIGDASGRLRVISTTVDRGRYSAHLQGVRGHTYRVRLLAPFVPQSIAGGEIVAREGSWITVSTEFPPGDGDWAAKDLVVSFEAPDPPRLANDRLAAEFGDRGLVALSATGLGAPYRFRDDRFVVVIGGRRYESRSLPPPTRIAAGEQVTYTWRSGPYTIDVVYELKRGWRFLSKQIVVRATDAMFRIDEVRLFDAEIGDAIDAVYVPKSAKPSLGTGDYGGFVRLGAGGLLAIVQNPFLQFARDAQTFSIQYKPEMYWRSEDGPFVSDRGLLAPYRATGRRLPAAMVPEWKIVEGEVASDGADEAEIEAFRDCVDAFLLYKPKRPLNVFIGWCVNDYQIDVADAAGLAEYKRIIDRAAELDAEYVLYAPSNSALSRREASVDDWSWEHVLWLGLGQKIRKGEWNPARDAVPDSVRELLDYAAGKHVKLLAYVYPVLPFSGNTDWLVTAGNKQYASLGVRSWQDHLVELLVSFHQRTGIGGYSFDHTFLRYPGTSSYAQWAGWRRVIEELRRRIPDLVLDGRQAYHLYGPWGWLAGSYPHPTFNDEQPESFAPFPDLHFDRVSADRERYTAYRYRNYEFAPAEIVPGFITHQTPRNDERGEMPSARTPDRGVVLKPIRARDWDYLGWRYSLLSSIAVAGWNNVINMIPARDADEYRNFSEADRKWFRDWIAWTEENRDYLRHTRTIIGQPAIGRIDGTSAIVGDRGYVFLFNPNARPLIADFALDESIGLKSIGKGSEQDPIRIRSGSDRDRIRIRSGSDRDRIRVRSGSDPDPIVLKELYPLENQLIGKPGTGPWTFGDRVSIAMDGQSARVLELSPAPDVHGPLVFGVPGSATLDAGGVLRVSGVRGEVGTSSDVTIVLPRAARVTALRVNNRLATFSADGRVVRTTIRFAGEPFHHAQQIGSIDPVFLGGRFSATVAIPSRIFDQLAARARAWPIPWTSSDLRTTWLDPSRLLLYVQIAQIAPPDDRLELRLTIDGRPIELAKAYTAIRPEKSTFVGFYADVSHLSPAQPHRIELDVPVLKPGQFQGVFLDNVETEYTDQIQIDQSLARADGR